MKSVWLAEFIGTFFLVFLGCGSLIAQELGFIADSHAALVFGGTVIVMVATFGHISYAHFNPAVSVGFFVLGRISFKQMLIYWSATFNGALLASLLHLWIFGGYHSFGANVPVLPYSSTFVLELIGTFMLMGVITVVAFDERVHKALPALAIGTTIIVISLVFGPLSGGSFNPARTLAPALLSGKLEHLPMYFISTIIGGALGALVVQYVVRHSRAKV